jgi:hypothetical protein
VSSTWINTEERAGTSTFPRGAVFSRRGHASHVLQHVALSCRTPRRGSPGREGRRGFADVACNSDPAAGRVIPKDRRISPSPVTCLTSPPAAARRTALSSAQHPRPRPHERYPLRFSMCRMSRENLLLSCLKKRLCFRFTRYFRPAAFHRCFSLAGTCLIAVYDRPPSASRLILVMDRLELDGPSSVLRSRRNRGGGCISDNFIGLLRQK